MKAAPFKMKEID